MKKMYQSPDIYIIRFQDVITASGTDVTDDYSWGGGGPNQGTETPST